MAGKMNPESLNRAIFREYDVRGTVGTDLTEEVALHLGRAIGTVIRNNKIDRMAIGRDVRTSSDGLHGAMLEGLLSTGVHVVDVGVCPTPLLYFSLFHLNLQGGVMITGSHNPAEFNGFKICVGRDTIHGPEIQKLYERIIAHDYVEGVGAVSREEIIPPYLDYIVSRFPGLKVSNRLKIAIDCGNGTAGLVVPELLKRFGFNPVELYCEIDGNFPNHHPDPTVEKNLVDLIEKVRLETADLGIAFDGDSDRIGVINDKGEILWGDKLLVLFSRDILRHHPGATIISEVKSSHLLYEDIRQKGGNPVMWKAGHSLIKAKMKETKAALGGEMSGHIFFADRYFGYDDAIYAACRLIEIVLSGQTPLSGLLADLPVTSSTPEIRIDCPDDEKFQLVEKLKGKLASLYQINDVDGVRVTFNGGWGLVRASNTQPILVLRYEAETVEKMNLIKAVIEKALKELKPDLSFA